MMMRRSTWFWLSATIRLPSAATISPVGALNSAMSALPLVIPLVPVPATVLTTPGVVILRIRWFSSSAT